MWHIIDYSSFYLGVQEKTFTYKNSKTKALMPEGWFATTWLFLYKIHATIITSTLELQQQPQNDQSILFPTLLHYKGIQLIKINAVQLFLQVFYFSEITNSDGYTLNNSFFSHKKRYRHSSLVWPAQNCQRKKARSAWKKIFER